LLKLPFNSYLKDTAIFKPIQLSESASLHGLRILVVDNNDDSLYIVTLIFKDFQAEIETAKSVDHAIEIIEKWKPDIVISDIIMPGKDGYSLIRFIRYKELFCGGFLPAVALTSYVDPESLNIAMDAGFQKVICKPCEHDELITTVANLVQAR
jgi:CheY-like chemotaxis protein